MKQAVIIDCVRTPIGRAHAEVGCFRDVRSDDLAVTCVKSLIERPGIDPAEIEDAHWVSREALVDIFAGTHPTIRRPRRGAIAQVLMKNWLAGTL